MKKTALENISEVQADEEYLMELPEDRNIEAGQIEKWQQLLGPEDTEQIRDEIKWLEDPIRKMIEPIIEKIKSGDYQLLIGDDASGRIPTLIVKKIIDKACHQKSRPSITTCFIAGTSMHDDEFEEVRKNKKNKIDTYIKKLKERSSAGISNALIVTELIETGLGLATLAEALKENQINPTTCAVSVYEYWGGKDGFYSTPEKRTKKTDERARILNKRLCGPVFWGVSRGKPGIYGKRNISGVIKHFSDLHATPIRASLPDSEKELTMTKMTIARDEANHVAERLISELLEKEQ